MEYFCRSSHLIVRSLTHVRTSLVAQQTAIWITQEHKLVLIKARKSLVSNQLSKIKIVIPLDMIKSLKSQPLQELRVMLFSL